MAVEVPAGVDDVEEYLVSGIKQHKKSAVAAVTLLIVAVAALIYFFYPAASSGAMTLNHGRIAGLAMLGTGVRKLFIWRLPVVLAGVW